MSKTKFGVIWRAPADGVSGRWIARIDSGHGRREKTVPRAVAQTARDRAAALAWAASQVTEKPAETEDALLADVAKQFLELAATFEKAPATFAQYESHCRTSIIPTLGELRCIDLEIPRLRAWVRELAQGRERSTCANQLSTLAVLLDTARGEGWTKAPNNARDPAVRAALPRARVNKVVVPAHEQLCQLIQCEQIPFLRRLRYLVAAYGLDDGTCAALRWRDRSAGQGGASLHVENALALRGPDGWATEQGPKTQFRRRSIPINDDLADALRWWEKIGWSVWVGREPTGDDFIFLNSRGRPWRPKSARDLRADLVLAGVKGSFDFKALRKYFATQLAEAGATTEERARLLGHRGPSTAAQHYTEAVIRQDRVLVAKLPRLVCPVDAQVQVGCSSAPDWSHLRDLNSRPTVYEVDQTAPTIEKVHPWAAAHLSKQRNAYGSAKTYDVAEVAPSTPTRRARDH